MSLRDDVAEILRDYEYCRDDQGLFITADELINLILDEVIEVYQYEANMQGIPYEAFDAIQKAIEQLKAKDDE
ncbi:hypothetical protein OAO19_03040 [Gammaproteobacteria bacterium]|nr:hypothetical protein [Gammaproteobacteria bacterium]